MIKKSAIVLISILALSQPVLADFKEHFDLGQQYLANYQYSGAVTEFKNALRINYLDNSARIGLINSYLARGAHYANKEKNWEKAAAAKFPSALSSFAFANLEDGLVLNFNMERQVFRLFCTGPAPCVEFLAASAVG